MYVGIKYWSTRRRLFLSLAQNIQLKYNETFFFKLSMSTLLSLSFSPRFFRWMSYIRGRPILCGAAGLYSQETVTSSSRFFYLLLALPSEIGKLHASTPKSRFILWLQFTDEKHKYICVTTRYKMLRVYAAAAAAAAGLGKISLQLSLLAVCRK